MTRDDIIRMAQEAGFPITNHLSGRQDIAGQSVARFERFAALVAAAEREACAQVAENGNFLHDDSPEAKFGKACAAAIRARGQS